MGIKEPKVLLEGIVFPEGPRWRDNKLWFSDMFGHRLMTVDIDGRRARLVVPGLIETRGEPILNPVTGNEHRVRIDMVDGFEYTLAEIGRGWSKASGPIAYELADSYGQFAHLHLSQSGIVH